MFYVNSQEKIETVLDPEANDALQTYNWETDNRKLPVVLYATYKVFLPAAMNLSKQTTNFTGTADIGVEITSNNEDFYVSVVPQNSSLTGSLSHENITLLATMSRQKFKITDASMTADEDVFTDTETLQVATDGLPTKADAYTGSLTVTITSGTE